VHSHYSLPSPHAATVASLRSHRSLCDISDLRFHPSFPPSQRQSALPVKELEKELEKEPEKELEKEPEKELERSRRTSWKPWSKMTPRGVSFEPSGQVSIVLFGQKGCRRPRSRSTNHVFEAGCRSIMPHLDPFLLPWPLPLVHIHEVSSPSPPNTLPSSQLHC
jgi:hypothetical protein